MRFVATSSMLFEAMYGEQSNVCLVFESKSIHLAFLHVGVLKELGPFCGYCRSVLSRCDETSNCVRASDSELDGQIFQRTSSS